MSIILGKSHWLTVDDLYRVATLQETVSLDEYARERIRSGRAIMNTFSINRLPVYGINTQFGDDAYRVLIEGDEESYYESLTTRQNGVMRALGCGVGDPCSHEIVRATMLLRTHTLSLGSSGVREHLIDRMITLVNEDVTPIIYHLGSIGASGDLIPLSTIARVLMGEGIVNYRGSQMIATEALTAVNMSAEPLLLKEGLAIANGTSFMTAIAGLAIRELCHLIPLSIAACAASAEAMLAMDSPYSEFVHEAKHHHGQQQVAALVRSWWQGSNLIRSLDDLRQQWRNMLLTEGRARQEHIQDYYSLRAIAHGFGPIYDNLSIAKQWIEEEMNSANDNPIVDVDARTIHSSANFLGDYVAVACDHLRADLAKASTWMHAIMANLIHPRKNRGLPSCLVSDPDTVTGFKTIQIMMASLAIDQRMRCTPVASVMLPTEGDNQDMVSLGTHSAYELSKMVNTYRLFTASMLITAAQALELRGIENASPKSRLLWDFVRRVSAFVDQDRPLQQEITELANDLLNSDLIEPWFLKPVTMHEMPNTLPTT